MHARAHTAGRPHHPAAPNKRRLPRDDAALAHLQQLDVTVTSIAVVTVEPTSTPASALPTITVTDVVPPALNPTLTSSTPPALNPTLASSTASLTSSAPSTTIPLPIPSTASSEGSAGASSASATGSSTPSGSGVPAAAIAVPVVLAILALLAGAFFWIRKRAIRSREAKRGTWGGASIHAFTARASEYEPAPPRPVAGSNYEGAEMQQNAPEPVSVQSPPISDNNSAARPITPIRTSLPPTPVSAPAPVPKSVLATVRCTFMTSLPDELGISMGERVTLLAEYDDGWGLCANAAGERGMVPLECLDNDDGPLGAPSPVFAGDWRQSRASSLRASAYSRN